MFTHILVPLDGSMLAERALPVAARLVRASGGRITLLQVLDTTDELKSEEPPRLLDCTEATHYLTQLAASPILRNIQVEQLTTVGDAASTILSTALSSQADVIVISRHCKTNPRQWRLGNVAEQIARYSSVPIFLLRENASSPIEAPCDLTQPLRMLVPLDGTAHAKVALKPAISLITALAHPAPGALHLAMVLKPLATYQRKEHNTAMQQAKQYLCHVQASIQDQLAVPLQNKRHTFPTITWSITFATDVAVTILEIAEIGASIGGTGIPGGCDAIAMSTHGLHGLQLWTIGSVTDCVLHTTKLPILVMHPKKHPFP
ncbi:universal stress protein UspA [Dictyobacter sp. S3.2.2.5]|uniref:Universal stress protein UspA n=1 Tax=Dictyobacter halimunensis TaxID=3026934 RepID=A0ABQ6FK74_9CHLR|nr:universal stress protein UspA [Dictyobacter sp. S3.2.2.5]